MLIKEMFAKEIDRDIKGVIKVGQADEENIKQELEEYVITRELRKNFADFFSSYSRGIVGHTDKMGVWISGFFGSGKSHFLKILSYLLENRVVDGKPALDYFIDGEKIIDETILANMKLAAETPTDVILFNIDSKSATGAKQSQDAILSVFLKMFNEMLGYCGTIPFLADLERRLDTEGRYQEFKERFESLTNTPWVEARYDFDFIQDDIVQTLVEMNFMSETAAWNWCERTNDTYSISIDEFAQLVQQHIASQGNNHHVVFLVDEMGQFIGDNSQLMLNLQTLAEDLGTACAGKAWVIVTSQQDIDSITKVQGDDFSKIQGRFDTRLSLSSANVDEVIYKRLLAKSDTATQTLSLLYDQKETIIKNLIVFNDEAEKKVFTDRNNFAANYPFVPYQFNLLASVLTSIRTHGASGKHLSEGERSMLALFQESAVEIMNEEIGLLIPFSAFYEPLHQFLDHSHKSVVERAKNNAIINPTKDEYCFAVEVLKTLFLIKYVKEIRATVENITTLMVDSIDTDRIALQEKVTEALQLLVSQTLVQKHGDIYVFLSHEEQEINRLINRQAIEMTDVIVKTAELVFEDLYNERRYRHSSRYSFGINRMVDDTVYGGMQNYDIGLRIITPAYERDTEEMALRMMSGQQPNVIIALPNDNSFLSELEQALKIEKFLRLPSSSLLPQYEKIKQDKQREMQEHYNLARTYLADSLAAANIYVNGNRLESTSRDIVTRIDAAMGILVATIYYKLDYIDTAMSEADIRQLFSAEKQIQITDAHVPNQLALQDMLSYVSINTSRHVKTSIKSLQDRFMKAPYGFTEDDVEWLVAKLFVDGNISLFLNSDNINLLNTTSKDIIRYITKREFVSKLMVEERERATDRQIRTVKEIGRDLFNTSITESDDDSIMQCFQKLCDNLLYDIDKYAMEYRLQPQFPGLAVLQRGKELLTATMQINSPTEFFRFVDTRHADFLDLAEDYQPVAAFLTSEQKNIFARALKFMNIFDDSKTFIVDKEIEALAAEITAIITQPHPYGNIYKLPDLLDKFGKLYNALLDKKAKPVTDTLAAARERVFTELRKTDFADEFSEHYLALFDELRRKLKGCNNVAGLQSIGLEADALKMRLLDQIHAEARKRAEREQESAAGSGHTEPPLPVVKIPKSISIKSITSRSSWRIESEADLDKYLAALKQRILAEMKQHEMINIEF